jgi:hypothetical protein
MMKLLLLMLLLLLLLHKWMNELVVHTVGCRIGGCMYYLFPAIVANVREGGPSRKMSGSMLLLLVLLVLLLLLLVVVVMMMRWVLHVLPGSRLWIVRISVVVVLVEFMDHGG